MKKFILAVVCSLSITSLFAKTEEIEGEKSLNCDKDIAALVAQYRGKKNLTDEDKKRFFGEILDHVKDIFGDIRPSNVMGVVEQVLDQLDDNDDEVTNPDGSSLMAVGLRLISDMLPNEYKPVGKVMVVALNLMRDVLMKAASNYTSDDGDEEAEADAA